MSELTVDSLTNQDIALCKAWVNFDGIGAVAINSSYNVSSITDNGTGNYTVNFGSTMNNTDYCGVVSSRVNTLQQEAVSATNTSSTASTLRVNVNGAAYDTTVYAIYFAN